MKLHGFTAMVSFFFKISRSGIQPASSAYCKTGWVQDEFLK